MFKASRSRLYEVFFLLGAVRGVRGFPTRAVAGVVRGRSLPKPPGPRVPIRGFHRGVQGQAPEDLHRQQLQLPLAGKIGVSVLG